MGILFFFNATPQSSYTVISLGAKTSRGKRCKTAEGNVSETNADVVCQVELTTFYNYDDVLT